MNRPIKLETLDDLSAQAAHYAEFCLRNSGKMAPTLFLIGPDGPLTCIFHTFSAKLFKTQC